jgi:mono/diheme cytochrome c family protein
MRAAMSRSTKLFFALAGAAAIMAFAAHGPVSLAAQQAPAPAPATDSATAGAPLYQVYCAACHGPNLKPAESVFDLRDLAPSDKRRFVNSVTRGKDSMPAWGALLTPQQIEAVWDYVMSRNAAAVSPAPGAAGGESSAAAASQSWPCGGDINLLVDGAGDPVWIGSDELIAHGISMPPPASSAGTPPAGRLMLDVLIDSQGRVKCARVAPGAGLAAPPDVPEAVPPAALEVVRKWAFRPFAAGGQPVAIYGHLQFDLEAR